MNSKCNYHEKYANGGFQKCKRTINRIVVGQYLLPRKELTFLKWNTCTEYLIFWKDSQIQLFNDHENSHFPYPLPIQTKMDPHLMKIPRQQPYSTNNSPANTCTTQSQLPKRVCKHECGGKGLTITSGWEEKQWFVVFTGFCGVNTLTMADFRLLRWGHWDHHTVSHTNIRYLVVKKVASSGKNCRGVNPGSATRTLVSFSTCQGFTFSFVKSKY